MNSATQLLYLSDKERSQTQFFSEKSSELPLEFFQISPDAEKTGLLKKLKEYPCSFIESSLCVDINQLLHQHSSLSHRLGYSDLVLNKSGSLWGENLFSEAFNHCFMDLMQKHKYQGSVLFLGIQPQATPIIEVLSRFGFTDFVFLDTKEAVSEFAELGERLKRFLKVQITRVDPNHFLKGQKTFSLCFVVDDHYEQQIIEDMSYFHFLSDHSCVFDLSRTSNFLFKEVKALGVEVVEFRTIENSYLKFIKDFLKKNLPVLTL